MKWRSILDSKGVLITWSAFLLITLLASIFIVNPTLNPHKQVFSWPQLQLQFAYTPQNGMEVLESWGPGAIDRYFSVIWIDLLFALSYGPAFALYIRRLGGSVFACLVPLVAMTTNLIETSLEMYWVGHHTSEHLLFVPFLAHSIIATIKWILVPFYSAHMAMLSYYWLRSRATDVAVRRPLKVRRRGSES